MPLSDEEMRLLAQMERALSEEDPRFASALRGHRMARATRGRLVLCVVGFGAGVAILFGGAVTRMTWLAVLGFVVMLAGATIALSTWRLRHYGVEETQRYDDAPDHPSGFHGLRDRLEERWHRHDGDHES